MTPDELRAIDAAVAEGMGWKLTPDPGYHGLGGAMFAVLPSGERKFMWHLKEHVYSGERPWSPTTNIAAAVAGPLDALYEMGCWIKISNQIPLELGKKWRVGWQYLDGWTDYVWANTMPEAICLAFLKAMGVEVGE
jgi:hypothetical protein